MQESILDQEATDIAKWYAGRNIFITGVTGFMGKVLLEKLLRCCPQIQNVYVLLRNKYGNDHIHRLDHLINSMIFDNIRDTDPNQLMKVIPIAGDVTLPNLGISDGNLNLLKKNVTIVIHCAANVRFDQKLGNAVNFNTGGTFRVLKTVEQFDKIDAFVHVSTAYCHCYIEHLEEDAYDSPHPPEGVLEMCTWMPPDILERIKPSLVGDQPNTYAYSKCLSEGLVVRYSSKFPVALLRPSIVTAAWKEPIPGWIENLNGPTGLIVGAGKGVIRTMHCNENYVADIMPVDLAINAVIVAAWHVGRTRPKEPFIANITASEDNPITWGKCLDLGRKHLYDHPFSIMLWYPDGSIKKNKLYHLLCVLFFHLLPAYLIDGLLMILRKKPFLVRVQDRIQSGLEVLQYYTTKEWKFSNENFKLLPKLVNKKDRSTFFMDIKEVDWNDYVLKYVLGARQYCLKEPPSSLPYARKLLQRLYVLDRFKSICLVLFGIWMLYYYSMSFLTTLDSGFQSVIAKFV